MTVEKDTFMIKVPTDFPTLNSMLFRGFLQIHLTFSSRSLALETNQFLSHHFLMFKQSLVEIVPSAME